MRVGVSGDSDFSDNSFDDSDRINFARESDGEIHGFCDSNGAIKVSHYPGKVRFI